MHGETLVELYGVRTGANLMLLVQHYSPQKYGTTAINAYGAEFGISLRDYVALGVSKWSSHIINDKATEVENGDTTGAETGDTTGGQAP